LNILIKIASEGLVAIKERTIWIYKFKNELIDFQYDYTLFYGMVLLGSTIREVYGFINTEGEISPVWFEDIVRKIDQMNGLLLENNKVYEITPAPGASTNR
jgi:hypothetical protein